MPVDAQESQRKKYNIHSHSSLGNLLAEYEKPTAPLHSDHQANSAMQHSNQLNRTRVKTVFKSGDDEYKERVKKESIQQYYSQTYDDMYKLRDYFRDEYHQKLKDKVQKQRRHAKKCAENPYQRITHSTEKFVVLEKKPRNRGDARRKCEKVGQTADGEISQLATQTSVHPSAKQPVQSASPQKLGQITESRESTPTSTHQWQVQISSSLSRKTPTDPYSVARLAAADLSQKLPQLDLPSLHCFDAGPAIDLSDDLARDWAHRDTILQRELYVKKLRRMSDLANSNHASTRRIFENLENDLHKEDDGPRIYELMPKELPCPKTNCQPTKPWLRYIKQKTFPAETIKTDLTEVSNSAKTANSAHTKPSHLDMVVTPPQPLDLAELIRSSKTIDPRCPSTLWCNYTNVAKRMRHTVTL